MVLSWYDLDQLIAVGGSGDLLADKENKIVVGDCVLSFILTI